MYWLMSLQSWPKSSNINYPFLGMTLDISGAISKGLSSSRTSSKVYSFNLLLPSAAFGYWLMLGLDDYAAFFCPFLGPLNVLNIQSSSSSPSSELSSSPSFCLPGYIGLSSSLCLTLIYWIISCYCNNCKGTLLFDPAVALLSPEPINHSSTSLFLSKTASFSYLY